MSIRNAAKAIILHENRVLLDQCHARTLGDYFALPGGGQNPYETMEEAVIRECLEETGYTVIPEAFVALYEEIDTREAVRQKYPDYAHKIFHIFRCGLAEKARSLPSDLDAGQLDCVWVDLEDLPSINLLPLPVKENLPYLIRGDSPLYLGTHWIGLEKSV